MWPSYVINLADNTARMENSKAQFDAQNIPFSRIDATNGWQLSDAEIARVYDATANKTKGRFPLVPAEIGCYLSHISAWEAIANGPDEGGFIFEDDFHAEPFLADSLTLLSDDAQGWDMVKLFTFDAEAKTHSTRKLSNSFTLVEPLRVPTCLIGYGLTKSGAQRLVKSAMPFYRPVDEDQKFLWETKLRVSLILPCPVAVGDQQAVTGTIGNARRAAKTSGLARLKQQLHEIRYQLGYRLALKRHWQRIKQNER